MPCNIYIAPNELTSPLFGKAFSKGSGGDILESYKLGTWAGFGSPQNWQDLQTTINAGYDWYYGDHAYFKRHEFYRITKNKYQHDGLGFSDCKRFDNLKIKIKPWGFGGRFIYICPQSETFFKLHNLDRNKWVFETEKELLKYTDRPIKIRTKKDPQPFKSALKSAYCVVVYTSNAAVEAIINGIPAITTGQCAATAMSGSLDGIERLLKPDNRREWAGVLADNQWTLDEIKQGLAWRKIND